MRSQPLDIFPSFVNVPNPLQVYQFYGIIFHSILTTVRYSINDKKEYNIVLIVHIIRVD